MSFSTEGINMNIIRYIKAERQLSCQMILSILSGSFLQFKSSGISGVGSFKVNLFPNPESLILFIS